MGFRKKRERKTDDEQMGFGDWGGYMNAKRTKLVDQFHASEITKTTDIFKGVAIHVNGFTRPPIDELKNLMAVHGGVFHGYQVPSTTHLIASNLASVKIKQLGSTPVVKPSWITDSIAFGKLLEYQKYLLYTNQSVSQPKLQFAAVNKPQVALAETSPLKDAGSVSTNETTTDGKNNAGQRTKASTKTAADPKFLEEFYNNSRLHLISTLGAEYKQLVNQLREKSNGKFPAREKLILEGLRTGRILSESVIMHIDMDCFFVSVGLRNHPELKGKPVAISHARNGQITNLDRERKANREQEFALYCDRLPKGVTSRVDKLDAQSSLSEIASCSYEARKRGIRNGMFLGQAVKLCPDLQVLSYDFEGYKEVSQTLYMTMASYTLDIEAVSCDEMYVDVTKILKESGLTVEEWAGRIREEIMTVTGCPCSTGFGANKLQARLATRRAKPAGQYYLKPDDVDTFMYEIELADLPGVGRATLAKLSSLGVKTCGDLQVVSLKVLQCEIGQKTGELLQEQARGVDRKPLNFHHERKSVSAEVNYGIRFKTAEECHSFLQSLSNEVHKRLCDVNMRARCLTLKLLVRSEDAPVDTAKFLGHGICDSINKSTGNVMINDAQVVFREVKGLYEKLNVKFGDLRGIGIQLSKLEKNAPQNTAMSNFLKQASVDQTARPVVPETTAVGKNEAFKSTQAQKPTKPKRGRPKGRANSRASTSINKYFGQSKGLPSDSKSKQSAASAHIDLDVLNELPEDLRQEIIKDYHLEDEINTVVENGAKIRTELNGCPDLEVLKELPEELRNEIIRDYQLGEKMKNGVNTRIWEKENPSQMQEKVERLPFFNAPWEQMKPIIKAWVSSSASPEDVDTQMIAEYCKQRARNRKIEMLLRIFNFFYRIFSPLNCDWHKAYFAIVNVTQEGMVAHYGGTLVVNRSFDCCRM